MRGSVLDLAERAGQRGTLVFGVDLDPIKECADEVPAHVRPTDAIGVCTALHYALRAIEGVHHPGTSVLGLLLLAGGFLALSADSLLLSLEEVHRDGIGV